MKKCDYKVVLDTELGEKIGTMQIMINENKIHGFLNLLKHTEPLYGNINTDGCCTLHGKIVTLIKEVDYTATGYIRANELMLGLKMGANSYLLKGVLLNQEVIF